MSKRKRRSPRMTKIRYGLETLFTRVMMRVFKWIGPDNASNLGGAMFRLVGPHLSSSQIARDNVRKAFPDLDNQAVDRIVKGAWDNLGRVAGEFPHIDWIMRNRVQVEGVGNIHALRDDNKPGIVIAAHLANWEVGAAVAGAEGLPMAVVYRAANNPGVQKLYVRGRNAFNPHEQIAKGGKGARQIMTLLKNGGHVGILVDQKLNTGIPVPFFGHDAMTAPAVAKYAAHFDCPVVPAHAIRLKGCNFKLIIDEALPLPNTGDKDADALQMMTTINQLIEGWIRDNPEQWLWMHRRWPSGRR